MASNIFIRRARVTDAAAYARIMNHRDVLPGLLQMPYGDEASWLPKLTETLGPGKPDVVLVAERNGEVAGIVGLHPCGPMPRRRHAMSIGLAVAPEAQRQGIGTALMTAICDHADNWLGLLRLELGANVDNVAAIALYKKFGFEIEGTARGYALRDGEYVDTHYMARLHPNPPVIAAQRTPANTKANSS